MTIPEATNGDVTTNHDDCDDGNANVNPGAKELCGNGVDDTCNGAIDEGCVVTCDVPAIPPGVCGCYCGHASASTCAEMGWKWDAKSSVCLGAPMTDADCAYIQNKHRGDGSGSNVYNLGVTCTVGFDANACDPKVDKGCYTVWPDADADGYGDLHASPKGVRTVGPGQATNGADCNDGSAAVHPGAAEVCGNAIDDDCSGSVDDGCAPPPKDCAATPTIPAGVCGCYCGAMSKSNCAALGWTWDDVDVVCLGPAMTSADCDAMQAKHRGDGSGSDVYNLGVTCSVGTGK